MGEKTISLSELAHSRSGDKGNHSNIGVIAYDKRSYDILQEKLTSEAVAEFFKALGIKKAVRYEMPNLLAFNFLLEGILAGGGSRSLRNDAQGKALGQAILEMKITVGESS